MVLTVFPGRLIVTQFLVLLWVIAIESFFFRRALNTSPRVSLEYAAILNLFAAIMGWLMFFIWESFLSPTARILLISCVFLSQCNTFWLSGFTVELIVFFVSFLWKWLGFYALRLFGIGRLPLNVTPKLFDQRIYQHLRKRVRILSNEALVVLLSHLSSHYVVLILLIIQKNYL